MFQEFILNRPVLESNLGGTMAKLHLGIDLNCCFSAGQPEFAIFVFTGLIKTPGKAEKIN